MQKSACTQEVAPHFLTYIKTNAVQFIINPSNQA